MTRFACGGEELGCAFSLETNLPANDEAYSQCYLHDVSICLRLDIHRQCLRLHKQVYSTYEHYRMRDKLEACDLLAYCGLPSDFELATSTSFYFATVLKNVVEADDCPPGWSYRGSDCETSDISYGVLFSVLRRGNDNQSNGAASSRIRVPSPICYDFGDCCCIHSKLGSGDSER